jgi:phosphoglycolate phosphatase
LRRVRAVLFDFDFTLADSSEGVIECFAHGFARVGLPGADPARIRETIGLSLPTALVRLHGVDDAARVAAFVEAFRERAEDVMVASTRWLERAVETVAACRAEGLATGICSTKKRSHLEGVLVRDGLGDLFDAVIGADDVPAPKPAPDALHAALGRVGVEPGRALYVGDHPVDARAAAQAGVRFAAVLTGPSRRDDFDGHPVEHFLASIEGVAALVRP